MLFGYWGIGAAMRKDTIFALSSGGLPSGVAVIRLSGPSTSLALNALVGIVPAARQATLRTIRNRNGFAIDSGLILFFPAPASFTGEDCAELQVHGGQAVIRTLLAELAEIPGLRLAVEGEFSRRAFENGKLDLVEVEGLADLIAAETEMQRRLAVEHMNGNLSRLYDSWSERLTRARALIEAELDFADEDDVPGSVGDQVWASIAALKDQMEDHLSAAATGEIIRDGFKVVIAGAPNAGKSSLMNALAKRDVAIVTNIAGTTRDILHVDLDINGFLVSLYDTAGLRSTEQPVEQEGVRRATKMVAEADLVLYLHDLSFPASAAEPVVENGNTIHVGTKADLGDYEHTWDLDISVKAQRGLSELQAAIERSLASRVRHDNLAIPSRLRHRNSLLECLAAIETALAGEGSGLDLRAEELRFAANALGRITGRVDVENLLDVIFSEFCIGK